MNEKTKQEYKRIYERLLQDYGIDPEAPTARKVARALKAKAEGGMSESYWKRLKTACVYMTAEQGFKDDAEKLKENAKWPTRFKLDANGETVVDEDGKPVREKIPDQRKGFAKSITPKQADRLLSCATNEAVKGAIALCRLTGMRPDEIAGATYRDGSLFIIGSKKTEDGLRGADRELAIDPEYRGRVASALEAAQTKTKDELRHGVARAAEKAFPTMKNKPTLKTFRHQLCSELKQLIKSGAMEAKEASYMLGHQSADSINKYGNSRSAKGSPIAINPAAGVDSVRTPSADLLDAMNRLTPAERMASSNDWEAGRKKVESEKAQNISEKTVARQSPDWGSLDL